jgi:hypothetical protein
MCIFSTFTSTVSNKLALVVFLDVFYMNMQQLNCYNSCEGTNKMLLLLFKEDTAQPQIPQTFSLIGSSEDRKTLKEKQDEEYQMSLEMDKKDPTDNEHYEIRDKELKEQLQDARKARVVPEPRTNFVAVKIRHPSLGLLSRRFPHNTKMYAVYDWAGSLCTDPAHFILTVPSSGNIIQPSSLVYDKYTLNMVESSDGTPSLLESDDEVQFLGFGQTLPSR